MCDIIMLSLSLWGIVVAAMYLIVWPFPVYSLPFAGHQGSSQSDLCTNTGFSSFKLPTCGWLQKGRSHSHMYVPRNLRIDYTCAILR